MANNTLVGVTRVYVVLWVLWAAPQVLGLYGTLSSPSTNRTAALVVFVVVAVAIPGLLLLGIRWIIRGFEGRT